jgi:hypothetical protein
MLKIVSCQSSSIVNGYQSSTVISRHQLSTVVNRQSSMVVNRQRSSIVNRQPMYVCACVHGCGCVRLCVRARVCVCVCGHGHGHGHYLKKKYTFRMHTLKKLAYLQHENTPTTSANCVNNTTQILTLQFLNFKQPKNEYNF